MQQEVVTLPLTKVVGSVNLSEAEFTRAARDLVEE